MRVKRLDVVVEWRWRMPLGGVDPERDQPPGAMELLDPVGLGAAVEIRRRSQELRPLLLGLYRSGTKHDRVEIEDAARRLRVPGNAVRLWTANHSLVFQTPPELEANQADGAVWVGCRGATQYVVHSDGYGVQAYAISAARSADAIELVVDLHLQLQETQEELRYLQEEEDLLKSQLGDLQRINTDLQEQVDLLQLAVAEGMTARLIKGHRDAEMVAAEWMRMFGFQHVRLTGWGSDAGVDVESRDGFAQVKLEANKTSRPALQQLVGACATRVGRLLFFPNAGYTAQAIEYADLHDIAAFEFDYSGLPRPKSRSARELSRSNSPEREVPDTEGAPASAVPDAPAQAQGPGLLDNLNIHNLPASWHR